MLKASVSGSFHRHISAIYAAVSELRAARVEVLSPADPRVVDHLREFLFVASDRTRFKKQVQQRHFEAIEKSDFLWLVCPDGYLGVSASMEIGWALKSGIPVLADTKPADVTAEDFVTIVPSLTHAITLAKRASPTKVRVSTMLLDPSVGARAVIEATEQTRAILDGRTILTADEANRRLGQNAEIVRDAFATLGK